MDNFKIFLQVVIIIVFVMGLSSLGKAAEESKCGPEIKLAPEQEAVVQSRVESASNLMQLGGSILLYATDHNDRYPDTIEGIKIYFREQDQFDWLAANVVYLGRDKNIKVNPSTPLAYDKSLLNRDKGTNVLYNDHLVRFEFKARIENLGIIQAGDKVEAQKKLQAKENSKTGEITLAVVDSDGKPVKEAAVYKYYHIKDDTLPAKLAVSDEKGEVVLAKKEIFRYGSKRGTEDALLYVIDEEKLVGFVEVSPADMEKQQKVRLRPACRVYGKVKSTGLEKLDLPLEQASVSLERGRYKVLSWSGRPGEQGFEFFVPPGSYELYADGTYTYLDHREINITTSKRQMEINIDLPADKLSSLIGKPAPELRDIKGWLGGKPLKLSQLRGKVVLLDFWGHWCGPCIHSMPKLMELHDRFSGRGLVIIAVHDDSIESVKQLQKELARLSRESWGGRELPFPVALDGGGMTVIEGADRSVRGATTAAYGIQAWPTAVLIDKQGKVVGGFHPENANFAEKLRSMLGTER